MGKLFPFVAFSMLFVPDVFGQTFALTGPPTNQGLIVYSQESLNPKFRHHKIGAVTIIGGSLASISVLVILYGIGQQFDGAHQGYGGNQATENDGRSIENTGFILLAGGIGMVIGGAIHDHRKTHQNKFGVIAPGKNKIGLAYNF